MSSGSNEKPAPAPRATVTPRGDDWDDDWVEVPVETISGSANGAPGNDDPLADMILELCAATTKLHVFLSEANEEQWSTLLPRYLLLRALFQELPTSPRATRPVGFDPKRPHAKRELAELPGRLPGDPSSPPASPKAEKRSKRGTRAASPKAGRLAPTAASKRKSRGAAKARPSTSAELTPPVPKRTSKRSS